MAEPQLTIWCNAKLPGGAMSALKAGVGGRRLIVAERVVNNVEPSHPDAAFPEAEIAFGQPDPEQMIESVKLKWVQLSSAGFARYDRDDLRQAMKMRGAMLSNASSVYAHACAEHAMAFLLAGARQLPGAWKNQAGAKGWPGALIRQRSRLLAGQRVLILGFGAIGRRLAELLQPLGMDVTAVRREVRGDEPIRVRPTSEVDSLLGQADHVINILPGGPGTDRFFNAARFGRMKPGAIFYNIGRGATVDQAALRAALAGPLAAAFLDVTDPEPLPPEHALWGAENCFITPHSAGGAADEFDRVVRHFLLNLARFTAGQPLADRIV